MIEEYLDDLRVELDRVGIRGRLRRRILLETEDHLRSDPAWAERYGEPAVVANRFADELATTRTRFAANATFVALATAGAGYVAFFLVLNRTADLIAGSTLRLAFVLPAAFLLVVAPQVAFVAGLLAGLRSVRRRSAAIIPAEEVRLLRRQTGVALGAGWVTLAALAIFGTLHGPRAVAFGSAALAVPLAWASSRFVTGVRIRAQAAGPAGDAYDDFGPLVALRRHPWLFCLGTATTAALAVFAAAALGGQPDGGVRNAVGEALSVGAGFWLFGPSLGLRRAR